MPTCGQPHPAYPTLICDQQEGNHRLCTAYHAESDDFLDWENPAYEPPKNRTKKGAQAHLEAVATRVAPDTRVGTALPASGFTRGVQESARAATRWTEQEKAKVMEAIIAVAKRTDEFTSDEIWAELGASVPVTKGLTAILMLADRRGILMSTGKTRPSTRGGQHDHGQRLTVWCSLIQEQR